MFWKVSNRKVGCEEFSFTSFKESLYPHNFGKTALNYCRPNAQGTPKFNSYWGFRLLNYIHTLLRRIVK